MQCKTWAYEHTLEHNRTNSWAPQHNEIGKNKSIIGQSLVVATEKNNNIFISVCLKPHLGTYEVGNSILCKEGIPPVQHIKDLCLCIASTRHLQVQVVPFCARAGSYIPYSVCLQLVRVKADETAAINTGSMLIPDIEHSHVHRVHITKQNKRKPKDILACDTTIDISKYKTRSHRTSHITHTITQTVYTHLVCSYYYSFLYCA